MFVGTYNHSLDNKGRIVIPAKFRELLGKGFVMTKGFDGCIFIYPFADWSAFEGKLKTLPLSNPKARKFIRFFLAGAQECEPDKQGRVLIPQNLREYAKITGDVVSIGVMNRVEIWDKSRWDDYNSDEDDMDFVMVDDTFEINI